MAVNYFTTQALQKKLIEGLREKAKELEEYKQTKPEDVLPKYEYEPEEMFEKPHKYERQVYYPKTAEQINKTVEDSLKGDYDFLKESLTAKTLSEIAELEKKRNAAQADKYYALNALDKKYEELLNKKQAKMTERGLGRSSIKEQAEKDLLDLGAYKKNAATTKYDQKDRSLSDKVKEREAVLERKLEAYQRKYDKNFSDAVNALTKEEEKKVKAASKANEGLTEQEFLELSTYLNNVEGEKEKRKKAEREALDKYNSQMRDFEQNNMLDRFNFAKNILLSMKPDLADQVMDANPEELLNLLGSRYYDKLKSLIRKGNVGKRI